MYIPEDYLNETMREGRKSNSNFTEAQAKQWELTHKKNIPFKEYLSKMPKNYIAPRGRCKQLVKYYT